MVTQSKSQRRQRGIMMVEMAAAMVILVACLFPLALSSMNEQKLFRNYYHQAIAMEIVDGEMEILRAGEWREFKNGRHEYTVRACAATNLPPGHFVLTVEDRRCRLEWLPDAKGQGGRVAREMEAP